MANKNRTFSESNDSSEYNDEPPYKPLKRLPKMKGSIDCRYRYGEVVWARLDDSPWWPAKVEWKNGQYLDPGLRNVHVRWYGIDHDNVNELTRERVRPFIPEDGVLLRMDISVEDLDKDNYNQCIIDATNDVKYYPIHMHFLYFILYFFKNKPFCLDVKR